MGRLTRDGTAEPVSRDQILRRVRGQGNIHFPCFQLTTSRIGNLTRLIHTLQNVIDHTYIHTYILPRVRRHRASKPQSSSERVLPWQVTMDQLICASLSHTHYWCAVGMFEVPAITRRPIPLVVYRTGKREKKKKKVLQRSPLPIPTLLVCTQEINEKKKHRGRTTKNI